MNAEEVTEWSSAVDTRGVKLKPDLEHIKYVTVKFENEPSVNVVYCEEPKENENTRSRSIRQSIIDEWSFSGNESDETSIRKWEDGYQEVKYPTGNFDEEAAVKMEIVSCRYPPAATGVKGTNQAPRCILSRLEYVNSIFREHSYADKTVKVEPCIGGDFNFPICINREEVMNADFEEESIVKVEIVSDEEYLSVREGDEYRGQTFEGQHNAVKTETVPPRDDFTSPPIVKIENDTEEQIIRGDTSYLNGSSEVHENFDDAVVKLENIMQNEQSVNMGNSLGEFMKCKFCGKQIDNGGQFQFSTSCSECAVSESIEKMLDDLKPKKVVKLQPYICNVCKSSFSELNMLEYHLKTHNGAIPYGCSLCDKAVKNPSSLKKHFKTHSEKNPRCVCGFCSRQFAYTGFLKQHLRIHSDNPYYHCFYCKRQFLYKKSVKVHILKSHLKKEASHKCGYCGKVFQYKCHLVIHLKTHIGGKRYQCNKCPRSFFFPTYLKRHIETVHSEIRNYPCPFCSKAYSSNCILNCHLKIHTKEKYRGCQVCGEKFCKRIELEKHMSKAHSEVAKQYGCHHCGKYFYLRSFITDHMRISHFADKTKRFPCSVCEKSFHQAGGLKEHSLVHSEEKFLCGFCGKKYHHKERLRCHLISHLLKRKDLYSCNFCKESFPIKSLYYYHLKRIHNEKS